MALSPLPKKKLTNEEQEDSEQTDTTGTPIRYLPLERVYSACYTASGSSNVMSKKVTARKLTDSYLDGDDSTQKTPEPMMIQSFRHVYTRRRKKPKPEPIELDLKTESNLVEDRAGELENGGESGEISRPRKNRSGRNFELFSLGIDSKFSNGIDLSRERRRRRNSTVNVVSTPTKNTKKPNLTNDCKDSSVSDQTKEWLELSYEDVDPSIFIGLQCQVYWPLDDEWYSGRVGSYNSETKQHKVKYDDGEEESLFISNEKVKFYISREEMQRLNLKHNTAKKDVSGLNNDELLALAAIFDDCGDIEPGDVIWAKLTGHAMWPAVVVNEADVGQRKGLKAIHGERSVPVQFFGTHDFAWISMKQVISFVRGLHSSLHLKCKQARFYRSLEEAKLYLREQTLPNKMLLRQNGIEVDDSESGEDTRSYSSDDDINCIETCPFEIDDLRVISLGKVVTDSEHFHDAQDVWPEGYTAERKFTSATDPGLESCYKMEVLRDPDSKFRPFFRVTMDNGEEFKGATPTACWNKIYRRIRKIGVSTSNGYSAAHGVNRKHKSGSEMFGFSNPKVSKLIKESSNYRKSSIYSGSKLASKRYQDLPVGYRPVHLEWKDLDKCNVCHMDEEYTNNVFLQCDRCLMMVHARCYGESEPVDGVLWLCNLCRPDAPEFPPPCCLCPVVGGAMKPTTVDGQWAHLACAIWIPETCLTDIKRMEPIDGISRINKDRWKLLCSICGVTYGACIQCSNSTCRVAYHPLCARAADLCVEVGDEDKHHLMSLDEDEDNQCIRLLSFCKKHRQPSNERSPSNEQMLPIVPHCSKFIPPLNPSGCARSEPYDFLGRRGRKEPEAVAAASLKRLYVENIPYLVTGYCQNGAEQSSSNEVLLSRFSSCFQRSKLSQLDSSKSVLNMVEKYTFMKETVRTRLTFGKSGIHRFGVFAKVPHKAGDMVIEYTGELVRGSIADRREHFIYDTLVGAGTYMFRIDDERVIDATRAGSIAQLINHSCEPNCYSRGVSINGVEHIIIFAKRDISIREELTYDYRFFSIGEQLACYCGFPRCRGVVNDIEGGEQGAKLWVPRNELIDWKGESVM